MAVQAVRNTTGAVMRWARSWRSTVKPSVSGNETSQITALGCTRRANSTAAAPVAAVCTSHP